MPDDLRLIDRRTLSRKSNGNGTVSLPAEAADQLNDKVVLLSGDGYVVFANADKVTLSVETDGGADE